MWWKTSKNIPGIEKLENYDIQFGKLWMERERIALQTLISYYFCLWLVEIHQREIDDSGVILNRWNVTLFLDYGNHYSMILFRFGLGTF